MPIWLLYIIVVAIWGTSWYGIEQQIGVVAPQVSLAYRFVLAAAILILFCLATRRRLRYSAPAYGLMATQGLLLFCGNYILFYFASMHLVSGLLAVCFSTVSLMNIFNLALLFRQKVDRRALFAALVGLIGLACVFAPELTDSGFGAEPVLGLGLSLLATYLASLGNMVSVRLKKLSVPVIESNTIGMTFGALFCIAFALLAGAPFIYDYRPEYTVSLIGLALFATVIGFGCYLSLVQRIGADRAGYSAVMFPIVALSLSTWLEGYQWSPLAGFGVLLVIVGNLLVLTRRREVATHPLATTEPRPKTVQHG